MSSYSVINCNFEFKCPEKLDTMASTPFENIRYCDVCQQHVYKCDTQEQVNWTIKNKQCCAITSPSDSGQPEITIGMPIKPYSVNDGS